MCSCGTWAEASCSPSFVVTVPPSTLWIFIRANSSSRQAAMTGNDQLRLRSFSKLFFTGDCLLRSSLSLNAQFSQTRRKTVVQSPDDAVGSSSWAVKKTQFFHFTLNTLTELAVSWGKLSQQFSRTSDEMKDSVTFMMLWSFTSLKTCPWVVDTTVLLATNLQASLADKFQWDLVWQL